MRNILLLAGILSLCHSAYSYDAPCYETECGGKCASGWTQMTTKLQDGNMQNKCDASKPRAYCCPSSVAPDPKQCRWSFNDPSGKPRTILQCFGYCGLGETLMTRDTYGAGTLTAGTGGSLTCTSDSQAYCCRGVVSIEQATAQGNCAWYGSLPDCSDNRCPDNKIMIKTDQKGDATQSCNANSRRAQCCDHPGNLPFYQAIGQKPPTSPTTSKAATSVSSSSKVSSAPTSSTFKTSSRTSSSKASSSSSVATQAPSSSTRLSSVSSSSRGSSSSPSSSLHSSTSQSSTRSASSTRRNSSTQGGSSTLPSKISSIPSTVPTATSAAQSSISKANDESKNAKEKAKEFSDDPSQLNKEKLQKAVKDAKDATNKAKTDSKNSGFDDDILKNLDNVFNKLGEAETALAANTPLATAAAAAAAATAAAAVAAEAANEESKEQKPTKRPSQTLTTTKAPTSTPSSASRTSSSASSSSSSSACPFCVSCADNAVNAGQLVPRVNYGAMDALRKRGTDHKQVTQCGVTAESGLYTQGNAGNKFRSYGYTYKVLPGSCKWDFDFKTAAEGAAIPKIPGRTYDTEHIFEAKLIPIFLSWVWAKYSIKNKMMCAKGEYMDDNIMIKDRNFRGSSSSIKQLFKDGSPFDELALNLSDDQSKLADGTFELTGLDHELNLLKENVFALDDIKDRTTVNDKLVVITKFAMLFEYLMRDEVADIWKATSQRMVMTLTKIDAEVAKDSKKHPLTPQGQGAAQHPFLWAEEYRIWETEHLTKVGNNAWTYVNRNKDAAIKAIKDDKKIGTPQLREKFITESVEPKFEAVRGAGSKGVARQAAFTGLVGKWT